MLQAYYNENDPAAVHVLQCLISDGVIAPGVVDDRSIVDVQADEIQGFSQYHFFAGGGLWSVALRLAGWNDGRHIWTASCPCQPFSQAGKGEGFDDKRHLWPHLFRIIRAARQLGFGPSVLVGEQVTGKAGYGWFNRVRLDLETEGYCARSVDFPSSAVNAPHIRNRQYWIALGNSTSKRCAEAFGESGDGPSPDIKGSTNSIECTYRIKHGAMADSESRVGGRNITLGGSEGRTVDRRVDAWGRPIQSICEWFSVCHDPNRCDGQRSVCPYAINPPAGYVWSDDDGWIMDHPERVGMADTDGSFIQHVTSTRQQPFYEQNEGGNYWHTTEWIVCHDNKIRRTEPDIRFLVNGLPGRVDLWSIAGNAINPQAAKEVIAALMDVLPS